MPVYYRNTNQPVGSARVMIDNPADTTNAKISFDRYRIAGTAPDTVNIPISSAVLTFEGDTNKPGFNANTTFELPEGLIENVTELTYLQFKEITKALFAKVSTIQDSADVAREAYYAAAALQGANNLPLV